MDHENYNHLDKELFLLKVGEKIRNLRITRGVSIDKVAEDIGISRERLSLIEIGKTNFSISLLSQLSKLLDVEARALLPD